MENQRFTRFTILAGLLAFAAPVLRAVDDDPTACLMEIERVCVHLEEEMETCLAKRGSQLSAPCRDLLKTSMTMMQDPNGPAACIQDVQQYCTGVAPTKLAACIQENQAKFSETCRNYLARAAAPSNRE